MKYSEVLARLQNLTGLIPSQSQLCDITGVKQSAMSNRAKENSAFKQSDIQRLNDFYGINLYTNTLENNQKIIEGNILNKIDCSEIPIKGNVTASMGYGLTICDENKTGTYAISNRLARDLGANIPECDVIFAKGDSMEPTIIGGDSLLVDKSKREVYDGRIYCVRYEGNLYAKRLQKLPPNKIKVVSDNKEKYDSWYVDFSKDISFDFEIIGEVLWWGRVAR